MYLSNTTNNIYTFHIILYLYPIIYMYSGVSMYDNFILLIKFTVVFTIKYDSMW